MLADLRDEVNEQTGDKVLGVKVPRPADPSTSREVFGTANFGKVSVHVCGSGLHAARQQPGVAQEAS